QKMSPPEPGGSGSLRVTPVAVAFPVFVIVMVKPIVEPGDAPLVGRFGDGQVGGAAGDGLRLIALAATDRLVVAVAAVDGQPLVGAGLVRGGRHVRGTAVRAVPVDGDRLGVDRVGVGRVRGQVQGEGDRAGRVVAARERGRVGQGIAAP